MKIDIQSIDRNSFMVHQHHVGEHECYLVQPIHIGASWSKDNLIFRSSLWDKEGNPVSLSFKKFFNIDEKPDLFPTPKSLKGARLMEKLDGSTLIFSKYKGHLIVRTRGTVDIRNQPNGNEIEYLLNKYNKFKAHLDSAQDTHSFLFEWITPSNRIVLDYGSEPDMALIGMIYHDNYDLVSQAALDMLAEGMGLRRPSTYTYDNLDDMRKAVVDMRDKEGVCMYYNNDQDILKIKSIHYLYLHRAKSEISSIDKVIDVYIDWFMDRHTLSHEPTGYTEFFDYITHKFDYEIANMAIGHISRICDAMKEVHTIMNALFAFAAARSKMPRKFAAAEILQAYGSTGRSAIVFKVLDGKPITADDYKKILYQVLK
jgi:hypothetical protein